MKKPKEKPVVVEKGDRVEKRGLGFLGTVLGISPFGWIKMKWDLGIKAKERPLYCTPQEIKKTQ